MKENRHQNVHRQIANLISLIELCLPLTEEINNTKQRLNFLPTRLENLKKKAESLKQKTSYSSDTHDSSLDQNRSNKASNYSQLEIEDTELELDFLVTSLEDTLIYLDRIKKQIGDLVALKERVEALQEERLVGITSERIYKLIEKQQLENSLAISDQPSAEKSYLERIWHKIADYQYSKRIAKSTAIAAGVILCFSLGSYSSMRHQINENNAFQIEEPDQLRKTPTDI